MELKRFGILIFFIISFGFFVSAQTPITCSSSDQILLRLSDNTNAHGEVFNGAGNYVVEICHDDVFGVAGSGDRTCTGSNQLLSLSSSTNAHAEVTGLFEPDYTVDVCYDGLECQPAFGASDCSSLPGYTEVVSLSSLQNAHLETASENNYNTVICCQIVSPLCGNGNLDPGEECDDGNTISGDGCSDTCLNEIGGGCVLDSAGWSVNLTTVGTTVDLIVKGTNCNGQTLTFEVFEDDPFINDPANINPANTNFLGGTAVTSWVAEWQDEGSNPEYFFVATLQNGTQADIRSGLLIVSNDTSLLCNLDGNLDPGEECDDGNGDNHDACSSLCEITTCGDSFVQDPNGFDDSEECDDGNLIDGDGCSSTCSIELGWICTGTVSSVCLPDVQSLCGRFDDEATCTNPDFWTTELLVGIQDIHSSIAEARGFDLDFCVNSPPGVSCECVWVDTGSTASCLDKVEIAGGGGGGSPAQCYTTQTTVGGDCSIDDEYFLTWESKFGDPISGTENPAEGCIGGTRAYSCPSTVKIPFFSFFNLIAALSIIGIIYFVLHRKHH